MAIFTMNVTYFKQHLTRHPNQTIPRSHFHKKVYP
jgi:hypothetical protein